MVQCQHNDPCLTFVLTLRSICRAVLRTGWRGEHLRNELHGTGTCQRDGT